MSRKPIDIQQPHECRQAIWDEIRLQKGAAFRMHDLDICMDDSSIREYLTGLVNAGYLTAVKSRKRSMPTYYTLIRDTGVEAPRVRKNGTPVTQGQGRRQIWNTISILKVFTLRDLVFNASTDTHRIAEGEAKSYCIMLVHAGYLANRPDGTYALIPGKWTGPHPPQVQRTKQIYDPNLRKVVYSRIEGGAE